MTNSQTAFRQLISTETLVFSPQEAEPFSDPIPVRVVYTAALLSFRDAKGQRKAKWSKGQSE